ncbi:hypothetical protein FFLO_05426 [Filobasidium floriforme]|uniref:Uncharacterized protein n=2 Tax=Filobasidium floriforme TaxID=5210 RepID=A0A8K0NRE0_9TREE|nr:hypothetical protein FFLO_05426 [Filobasidium floriforme]
MREHGKELSMRIKARMNELNPQGWKFAVIVQINQNLGQGGRADLATHWAVSDLCIQELWSNEHLLCACFALAIKAG